jgi:hypothetical protein
MSQNLQKSNILINRELEQLPVSEQLKDVNNRLFDIEDKLDHVLYHHGHDANIHSIHYDGFGGVHTTSKEDPNSHHSQMKMEDMATNPFGHFMGGGYAMPAGVMSQSMMGYGNPYGSMGPLGMGSIAMGGYNFPDNQTDNSTPENRKLYLI